MEPVLMARLNKLLRQPAVVVWSAALVAFLLVAGARWTGHLEFLELAAHDTFVRLSPKFVNPETRITLIAITEPDIRSLGRWPLTDQTLARALRILLANRPRAVGLDIYRDIPVPPGGDELRELFTANPNLIGVMTVGERGIPALPAIRGTAQAAFGDLLVDTDGIVRRGLLFLDDGENSYTSLALRLATLYLQAAGISLAPDPGQPEHLRLGKTTIPPLDHHFGGYGQADARGYQFLLDFKLALGADPPFRTFSLRELLSDQVPATAIADKIVLLGVNAESVKDDFFTPLSREGSGFRQTPGLALHGQIASQLLRLALDGSTPITAPAPGTKLAWLFLWGLAGSVLGYRARAAWPLAAGLAGGLGALCGLAYLAFVGRWWIPLAPPALSYCLAAAGVTALVTGRERRDRALLMRIFAKHVSKEVAQMIWEQRDQVLDNGRPRSQDMTVTVFFSDLRGFSTTSEKLVPQELIDWLNVYMESMAGLIMKHGGIVNSYAGDGIKADFGVPFPRQRPEEIRADAANAVACALAMEREMARLNAIWRAKGLPAMGMRVGIYTGPVVAGLLGSSQRQEYTTIGDTVNIASRLESFDKEVGKEALCRILIGDSTRECLGNRFVTEIIGEVSLKGKERKILVHRVMGEAGEAGKVEGAG